MANIYDIAKLTGVSKTTVSKVINHQYGVHEDTRKLVQKAMEELNYTPNHAARSLATNRSGVLGVVYDTFEMPIYIHLATLLEQYATAQGYRLVFCNCNDDPHAKSKYVDYFMGGTADGIIFFGSDSHDREIIKKLKDCRFPCVVIENHFDDMEINNILIDNTGGARMAVNYLISLGHKRIAHITGNIGHRVASDRLNGYMQALQEHGFPFDPGYVLYTRGKRSEGAHAAEKLLKLDELPTALLVFNDVMAYEVIHFLSGAGFNIPRDFSVIGFDNISNILSFIPASISLTSVAQPMHKVAEETISVIAEALKDREAPLGKYEFATSLVEGETCGKPAGS